MSNSVMTWGEFQAAVYEQAKMMGLSEDDFDKIEVARINCSPDEGVKVMVRKLSAGDDADLKKVKRLPIYMIIT